MADTPLAVLTAAAALIAEYGHCRGNDALDDAGRPVLPHMLTARARGVTGALVAAGREASGHTFMNSLRALAVAVGAVDIADGARPIRWDEAPATAREWCAKVWQWEDAPGRTPAHVLKAFDRAKEFVS